ncbi:MAG: T9SS type A sorting domain-containing protein [Bacteroidota bacterium]
MNRLLFFTLFACIANTNLNGQSAMLCRQVLASAGKDGQHDVRYFSYTVGESFTSTLSGTQFKTTEGFHQPELCKIVATENVDLAKWQIEIFPNPTEDYLNIRYAPQTQGRLEASVVDLLGRTVLSSRTINDPSSAIINCSNWQPGVYILLLTATDSHAAAVIRFIKV